MVQINYNRGLINRTHQNRLIEFTARAERIIYSNYTSENLIQLVAEIKELKDELVLPRNLFLYTKLSELSEIIMNHHQRNS